MKLEKGFEKTIVAIVAYSSCSVAMTLLNKLIMNTYKLNYPNSLLLMQNGGALLLIVFAKRAHLIDYPGVRMKVAKQWFLTSITFVGMIFTSMKSLEMMSVSAQTVIKNLAIILTAIGDNCMYGKDVNIGMYCSFALIIVGSYLCARGDPWVTRLGLFWTFANIIMTVFYTLSLKSLSNRVGKEIGRYGPSIYNNLLSLPLLFLAGCNELPNFFRAVSHAPWQPIVFLALMILVSSHITLAVFFCMEMTSPTTFSVVGTLNKIPITFLGILIFQQFPEMLGYIGIAIAFMGGILYTLFNLKNRGAETKAIVSIKKSLDASTLQTSKRLEDIV